MITKISASDLDQKYLSLKKDNAQPISVDFSQVLVNKPWGKEYLFFKNSSAEIWSLFIKHNNSTSVHCHPNKKTCLIALEGQVIFSSLNDSHKLKPMDAVIIEQGVFHSTLSIGRQGAKILEIETPPMKHDLFRLEDKYGRVNKSYEGSKEMITDITSVRFGKKEFNNPKNFCDKNICLHNLNKKEGTKILSNLKNETLIAVLSGKIYSEDSLKNYEIGDIFYAKDILTTGKTYKFEDTEIISIQKS